MSLYPPFTPSAPTVNVSSSGSSASVALTAYAQDRPKQVLITSPASNPLAYVAFGNSGVTAATTDLPILPGTSRIVTVSAGVSHAAIIPDTASATKMFFTTGHGGA